MQNANEEKKEAKNTEQVTLVRYIAIQPCLYKDRWLDRNDTIDIPSNVKVTHLSLKPYDEKLVAKRIEDFQSDEVYSPIQDALGNKRIKEATVGLKPRF